MGALMRRPCRRSVPPIRSGATRRCSPTRNSHSSSLREQVGDEASGCYFDDVLYADGEHVASGSTLLRCEHGVWIEAATRVP